MLKPLIIWGAKGHAKVLNEFAAAAGYEIVALFDNDPEASAVIPQVPLHIGKEGLQKWQRENPEVTAEGAVAIGGDRGTVRHEIQDFLAANGISPATLIHPTAFVAGDAEIGAGTQILAQAAVGTDCRIGEACIINTSAGIDHEGRLGHGVHLAPGARLAGEVSIGDYSLVAVGAIVLPRIRIGQDCIVGAGAVVTRDVPDHSVVYGNPARIISKR
jgi:sugar O-acyltransferase (sialic acid O-acetyltransferase NeuD family)